MQLEGKAISHIEFGKGVVTGLKDNVITIVFSQAEKKFLFPDAFERFLTLRDTNSQMQITELISLKNQENEIQMQAEQKKQKRLRKIQNLKISPNSQAAFGFVENEQEKVFESWTVSTGHYLSGYSKGDPRIPTRLKPNSACLLTECPSDASEQNRKIIGAFMVTDDFDGFSCRDGIIQSHDKYKIKLQAHEALLFWDYFEHDNEPNKWGKTEIKYFSNKIMQQILYDMQKITLDSPRHQTAIEFYKYFTFINRLSDFDEEKTHSKIIKVHLEYNENFSLQYLTRYANDHNYDIFDLVVARLKTTAGKHKSASFVIDLKQRINHAIILEQIRQLSGVTDIKEISL